MNTKIGHGIELVEYDNGKFGINDASSGEKSGPRYRNREMAEKTARSMAEENARIEAHEKKFN